MKLLDYILFSTAVALFIIGIYETMVMGVGHAYGIFMVSLGLLFVFGYRKSKREQKK
ncbi:hypothetical protein [Marinoscillum furvescens]|uniref:Uncharacterized protein n=1 Tax=Marinoscillum furvescens DSM 4134 TaxID=1122208 RepID=A0A3D9L2A4_MARFU|nr:hypothetical protein [Marinoscillum furvescens]RED98858.1 hypothetical protein C7460_10950 [Marinoscillum furvescens DSM 4134]